MKQDSFEIICDSKLVIQFCHSTFRGERQEKALVGKVKGTMESLGILLDLLANLLAE